MPIPSTRGVLTICRYLKNKHTTGNIYGHLPTVMAALYKKCAAFKGTGACAKQKAMIGEAMNNGLPYVGMANSLNMTLKHFLETKRTGIATEIGAVF